MSLVLDQLIALQLSLHIQLQVCTLQVYKSGDPILSTNTNDIPTCVAQHVLGEFSTIQHMPDFFFNQLNHYHHHQQQQGSFLCFPFPSAIMPSSIRLSTSLLNVTPSSHPKFSYGTMVFFRVNSTPSKHHSEMLTAPNHHIDHYSPSYTCFRPPHSIFIAANTISSVLVTKLIPVPLVKTLLNYLILTLATYKEPLHQIKNSSHSSLKSPQDIVAIQFLMRPFSF